MTADVRILKMLLQREWNIFKELREKNWQSRIRTACTIKMPSPKKGETKTFSDIQELIELIISSHHTTRNVKGIE